MIRRSFAGALLLASVAFEQLNAYLERGHFYFAITGEALLNNPLLHETLQLFAAARMAQFPERLGFDLADAFTCDVELLSYFLQRVVRLLADTEPPPQYFFLALRQRIQNLADLLVEVLANGGLKRRRHLFVFDEIPQMAVLFLPDGSFEGNRLFRYLHDLPYLLNWQLHGGCYLLGCRFPSEILHEAARRPDKFVHGFNHMHGNTDCSRLVGDRPRDRLPDPPSCIGAEFVSSLPFKLVHSLHEADVAFLNKVQELQTAIRVFLGDGYHKPEVCFHQLALGDFRPFLRPFVGAKGLLEVFARNAAIFLNLFCALDGVAICLLDPEQRILLHFESSRRIFELPVALTYLLENIFEFGYGQSRLPLQPVNLPLRHEHLAHHLPKLHDQTVRLSAVDVERLELVEQRIAGR